MYDEAFFAALTGAFERAYPAFDAQDFLARIYDEEWEARELKQRMRHIALTLGALLPDDYRTALAIVREAARHTPSGTFGTIIFPDFVELYGLDDWEASIPALEQFTQQSSAEFAIRPFILREPERTMAQMLAWTGHASEHVRRLASEGCRPRLPWGIALTPFKADPAPILPILERLKTDPSEFVRRSVANNLNDISKDNPHVTLDVLRRWQAIDTEEIRWLTKHALRTLIKKGDPGALDLLGFGEATVRVENLAVEPQTVAIGAEVALSFDVVSHGQAEQPLVIDYVVYLMRKNGQQTPKVFKLKQAVIQPGETIHIARRHSFRPVTTRVYYPGAHGIEVQINGQSCGRVDFEVTT
ncbi:MAG: DNA alkylation repair protein [Anaerolineae bacterium]|nr:DNA alkylation repair protein [Anaerolineae bacterium]